MEGIEGSNVQPWVAAAIAEGRPRRPSWKERIMEARVTSNYCPWNKGKLVGQKAPLKAKEIWAIRTHLHMNKRVRDLALFNLGFDSKLRGCDLVGLRVRDISTVTGFQVALWSRRAGRSVPCSSRSRRRLVNVEAWIQRKHLRSDDFLFPSRVAGSAHLGTRQYARILHGWVEDIGLDTVEYGTHSMRRSKASLIYKTKNLRAVQILLGHSKLESTVRYLGIEVDDALEIAEQIDV
jgi:integrase